ncbi:MAG: ACT domain-containing protein [Ignavibacteriales bacterium]|nr:ACT domain-containing protein [Ignavibacteriales bacterium]
MKLTEEEIRKLTLAAIQELGEKASPESVRKVVEHSISKMDSPIVERKSAITAGERIILTSFGTNQPGVIAAITKALSDFNCDIQDMSQKLMAEYFTVIILVDISSSNKELKEIQSEMNTIAERMKIKIFLQHEDIFRQMHRL